MTISGQVLPGEILRFNVPFSNWYYDQLTHTVIADNEGRFRVELPVARPQTVIFDRQGTRLHLYAEPDGALHLVQADSLRFSGQLGAENEFRRKTGLMAYQLEEKNPEDILSDPEEIRKALAVKQEKALASLEAVSADFTKDFITLTRADIRYFVVSKMWELTWTQSKFDIDLWKNARARAHENVPLSDSLAVNSYHYQVMVSNYIHYLNEQAPDAFKRYAEQVFQKPFEEVDKEIQSKGTRYWEYRALRHVFEGVSQQYALAWFIAQGIFQGDLGYLDEAYHDFLLRFPKSRYHKQIEQMMQPYLASRQNKQNGSIRFLTEETGSLDSLIRPFKGKLLYIDLWGTWCSPCRSQFAYNKALKENFASEDIEFVYVAVEHAPDPAKKWKETVAFYNLSGYHILAGRALEADLRKRYGQDDMISFPSYILVDKSGNIITLHAKRPSDKEELYQQIRKLL